MGILLRFICSDCNQGNHYRCCAPNCACCGSWGPGHHATAGNEASPVALGLWRPDGGE